MPEIRVIKSNQADTYHSFFRQGLVSDEESFRISPNDDANASFPTADRADSFTLGAYAKGSLAGVVSFAREGAQQEKLRHKGLLFRMYVAREYRGQGIGQALIQALLDRVQQIEDIEQVSFTVIANNQNATRLYKKLGFITFSSEKNAIKWKGKYFAEDQMVLRFE